MNGVSNMGLFGGDNQPKKDYGGRVGELTKKIEQLESHGMTASANRLKQELAKLDRPVNEKVKPMSVGQLKSQIKQQKAANK